MRDAPALGFAGRTVRTRTRACTRTGREPEHVRGSGAGAEPEPEPEPEPDPEPGSEPEPERGSGNRGANDNLATCRELDAAHAHGPGADRRHACRHRTDRDGGNDILELNDEDHAAGRRYDGAHDTDCDHNTVHTGSTATDARADHPDPERDPAR